MKCENCGSELIGAAIVCRQCNHNNAQGRVSQWRARRTGELPRPAPSTRSLSPLAGDNKPDASRKAMAESRPLEPRRSGPIPFEPKIQINHASPTAESSAKAASTVASSATAEGADDVMIGQYPPWRAQLKERVKQARERKVVGGSVLESEPDEAELDPNPIVEAALKRIRWSEHTQSSAALTRVARNGSQASALAEALEFEAEPEGEIKQAPPSSKVNSPAEMKPEPKPAVRGAQISNNPLLARNPNTHTVNRTEAGSGPARQPVTPRPERKSPLTTGAEARIDVKPAVQPAVNPASEGKDKEANPRITGELKAPPLLQNPAPVSQSEKSPTTVPGRKTVETKIIELPQSSGGAPSSKQKASAKQSATIWVRTLAAACDFEIIATAYLPLFASYATLNTSLGRESLAIMFVLLATLTFCYQMLTLVLADRTSGMACLNLRLINVAGGDRPISLTQKFARAVAATAAFLCPPLNLIVMQSNQQRYTLPDLLSGTTLAE